MHTYQTHQTLNTFYLLMEPRPVLIINQSVIVHAIDFMDPESNEGTLVLNTGRLDQQDTQHHTGKVSQVEGVVRFGRGGKEVLHGLLVHLHCGSYYHGTTGKIFGRKVLLLQVIGEYCREYPGHRLIIKLIDGNDIKVSEEPGGDWVTPTPWRTHGTHELNINKR